MTKTNVIPFNPLDKRNLAASVAEAMLEQPPRSMSTLASFEGIGVYALYYIGDFKPYERLTERNRDGQFLTPIYVGKAIPEGGRKGGGVAADTGAVSRALYKRLHDHIKSIKAATSTLDVNDFYCRYLVVDDIWIPLGESLLIAKFSPVWNVLVDGFGNHTPGKGRFNGLRPRWDVLHPGRAWADNCAPRLETAEEIARDVETFFSNIVFPASHHILAPSQQPKNI